MALTPEEIKLIVTPQLSIALATAPYDYIAGSATDALRKLHEIQVNLCDAQYKNIIAACIQACEAYQVFATPDADPENFYYPFGKMKDKLPKLMTTPSIASTLLGCAIGSQIEIIVPALDSGYKVAMKARTERLQQPGVSGVALEMAPKGQRSRAGATAADADGLPPADTRPRAGATAVVPGAASAPSALAAAAASVALASGAAAASAPAAGASAAAAPHRSAVGWAGRSNVSRLAKQFGGQEAPPLKEDGQAAPNKRPVQE